MAKEFKSLSELEGWVGEKPVGFAIYRAKDIKEFIKKDEELIVRLQEKEITFDEFLDLRKELIGDKLI